MALKKLVIVESPTKAKTLAKILDKSYKIEASNGHIRDLPKKGLAVDVEHDFAPEYDIPDKAKKVVTKLKKVLPEIDGVVLATDPDREGEAIAWHLKHILTSVKKYKDLPFERVVFHELTKDAVLNAFNHPSKLNDDLVNSQQARRVLDRLVGYKLSPLLWKKVRFGLSAGRVQSVAVRLVVERERERDAFVPEEYWSIIAGFISQKDTNKSITATLEKKDGKKLKITSDKQAKQIESEIKTSTFNVSSIKRTQRVKKPYAPYKTSTLQQALANTFGMSASKTMSAAQKLFENGLITYHRTDSLSLSPEFVKNVRSFAKKEFGANYLPKSAIFYKTKSKNAQEAHEAIRPTNISLLPKNLKASLTDDSKRVYSIIWKRSVECQLEGAVYDQTRISIFSSTGYEFKASGSVIKFDGWLAVGKFLNIETDKDELVALPELAEGEGLDLSSLDINQHFTQPPGRFSDATLIKKLEELEIGRPSTYAPTLNTIQRRGYVERENRYYKPKDVAYVVSDLLVKHFPTVSGYEFTAEMEKTLDSIADGKKEWVPVIREFYHPFEQKLEEKDKALNKHDVTNLGPTGEKCPDCGKKLIFKLGKYGKFISCSDYPECEYASPIEGDDLDENGEVIDYGSCPECETGKFTLKQGRFGKFLACSNYPKCKTTKPYLDKIGMKCPECGDGEVVAKKAKGRTFFGCSNYPKCKYASWKNPLPKSRNSKED